MKRKQLRFIGYLLTIGLIVALTLGLAACGTATTTSALSSIAVTPTSPATLTVGSSQQFTATGTDSNGSTTDISYQVTWASSNTGVATIDSSGWVTPVAAGTTDITATLSGIASPSISLTVISLSAITVTPATPTALVMGSGLQFTATGTYSDGSTANISSKVIWSSDTTGTQLSPLPVWPLR